MSNAIKRAIAKRKEKKANRGCETDLKYINDNFGTIASVSDHHEISGRPWNVANGHETEGGTSSASSFSTTATTDDNRGAGWSVDKYFYQPAGRRFEKLAFRIAMPLLSPGRIFRYIDENKMSGILWFNFPKSTTGSDPTLESEILTGLNCLVHQTQWACPRAI